MDDIIALSAKHDIEEEREAAEDRIESSREWHENIWLLFTILSFAEVNYVQNHNQNNKFISRKNYDPSFYLLIEFSN